jgi:pyruvate/2-oxoglutarate dehydrogenase complex dihydrolipoamide dehydrogenase (E3) component
LKNGKLSPYAVFIATGADAFIPGIEGSNHEHVYTTTDILNGAVNLEGKIIAVIGSGMTGLETAELLAEQGNTVTVYEMANQIGGGAYFQNLIDVTT